SDGDRRAGGPARYHAGSRSVTRGLVLAQGPTRMSQSGAQPDGPRLCALHMIRPSARHVIPLLLLMMAACFDRPSGALSSDRQPTGDVRDAAHRADSTNRVVPAGVTPVTAAAAAASEKKGTDSSRTTKPESALPNRNRRDS